MVNARLVLNILILIAFSSTLLHADFVNLNRDVEDFEKSIRNYKQERWSAADGLPVNTLLEIAQTKDGYLWISSFDGLVKFNGIKFELFSRKLLEVVKNNVCKAMVLDSEDRLWVGTHGSGLFYYEDCKFQGFAREQGFQHHVNRLFCDSKGTIWVGSIGHGLFKVDGDSIVPVLADSCLADKTISSFAEDDDGYLWIGTEGDGILRWKGEDKSRFTSDDGLPSNLIFALLKGDDNRIWVGTDKGVASIEGQKVLLLEEARQKVCRAVVADNTRHIWFGFDSGIARYTLETGEFESLGEENGFGHLSTKDIKVDREDNIWVATKFGELIQLRSSNFSHLAASWGIRGKTIYSVSPTGRKELFVASNEGYLDVISPEGIKPYILDSELIGKRIRHVMEDKHGRKWYATYSGLLLEEPGGRLRWFNEENGFPDNRVRISYEDSKGNIWVGTRGKGLLKLSEDFQFEIINPDGCLDGALVMSIQEDKKGVLWVGTSGDGLIAMSDGELVKQYNSGIDFVSDIIFNTYIDSDDVVWVAANGGVARIEDGKCIQYNSDNGMLSDSVYDIVEDKKGNFWIPCNIGLIRVKKTEFAVDAEQENKISNSRLFNHYDGIQAPFTATSKAYVDTRGVIWLPTFNGVVYADTERFMENMHQPLCHITRVTVDSEVKKLNKKIIIQPGEKRVRFDFNALSLAAPLSVNFKTMLEGYDGTWSEPNSDRSVSFTNLAPGNYTFKVIASNNDGFWSEKDVSIDFYVAPSLLQQGWFLFLIVCFLALAVVAVIQLRVRAIKKRERALQILVEERTAEINRNAFKLQQQAEELKNKNSELEVQKNSLKMMNSELESFSHVVSHDLRAPLNVIKGYLHLVTSAEKQNMDPENYSFLNKISDQTKRMNSMIVSLLEMSKASRQELKREKVNLSILAQDIMGSYQRTSQGRKLQFKCAENLEAMCDETLVRIAMENLFGNAYKYTSKADEAVIEFGMARNLEEEIYFVKDNGTGFSQEKAEELFCIFKRLHKSEEYEGIGIGLSSVKRIIERHGGRIWAESQPGNGAIFYFSLN